MLAGKTENEKEEKTRVTALKIPYTSRTRTLQKDLKLSTLQDKIEHHCPVLSRASIGRFVIANFRTSNIREKTWYRIKKQYIPADASDQDKNEGEVVWTSIMI